MHVETLGSGPRMVLVHGSVTAGWRTWNAQKPLAQTFTLVVPIRSGYPPNPPLEAIDFDDQAAELLEVLEPGDHLVGHSYGGVVSLLAAPKAELASLTVLEPPAFGVARGHPAVEEFLGQAVVPFDELAAAPFPKLVVSGAHNAAFDAVCDVLEERLGAQRAVLPGAGHPIPRLGEPLNALLEVFAGGQSRDSPY
jgi:pimeloyl-ACP methyl ester carboxylesterase